MPSRIEMPFVVLLFVLLLLPLWCFSFIPNLDGPVHIYIAHTLTEWSSYNAPRLHQIFQLNLRPTPNWTIYILLEILMRLFSPQTSERLLLSAYVLAMPVSFVVFAKLAGNRELGWSAGLLAIPLIYNATFYFGFYNFCLSLPLFVVCLGLLFRYLKTPSVQTGCVFAVASLALYFTHIAGWAAFAVAGLGLYLWRTVVLPENPGANRLYYAAQVALRCLLPVLPVLLLASLFMARNDQGVLAYAPTQATFFHRIWWLLSGSVLFGNSIWELVFIAASFSSIAVLTFLFLRGKARALVFQDGLIFSVAFVIGAALAVPDMLFGGGWTAIRLQIFVFIIPMLWLSTNLKSFSLSPIFYRILFVSGACLLVFEMILVQRMSDQVGNVVSAERYVRSGRTILPLVFEPNGADAKGRPISRGISFLMHSYTRVATDRGLIPLRVHQAWAQLFPLHYRDKANPYRHLNSVHELLGSERDNPALIAGLRVDIESYERASGQTVDYILIAGTLTSRSRVATRATITDLQGKYYMVAEGHAPPGYLLLARQAAP